MTENEKFVESVKALLEIDNSLCGNIRILNFRKLIWFADLLNHDKELTKKYWNSKGYYQYYENMKVKDIPDYILTRTDISKRSAYDYLKTLKSLAMIMWA